jgi:hypothetical protein
MRSPLEASGELESIDCSTLTKRIGRFIKQEKFIHNRGGKYPQGYYLTCLSFTMNTKGDGITGLIRHSMIRPRLKINRHA